jgi:hypothetical protein
MIMNMKLEWFYERVAHINMNDVNHFYNATLEPYYDHGQTFMFDKM